MQNSFEDSQRGGYTPGDGVTHRSGFDPDGPVVQQVVIDSELVAAYEKVAALASELCGACDAESEDIGTGARSSGVILRELGPATTEVERIKKGETRPTYGLPKAAHAELEVLLRRAAEFKMTPAQIREQRISWAYGNMPHGSKVTREQVEKLHDELYGKHG